MTRVSNLTVASRSPVAKFHELRLKYWNNNLDIVCCFEGSDDVEFFLPHVCTELEVQRDRVDFVNCGGKGVVLRLFEMVAENSWNMNRLGFFVDRDLQDFISCQKCKDEIYVTDYYSIESHVLDDDFFDRIWTESFRLSISDERRHHWKIAYYNSAQQFAEFLFSLTYMAIACKRVGGRVDFDRIKLDETIGISENGSVVKKARKVADNYSAVFLDCKPSFKDIRAARKDMKSSGIKFWLRGKFAIWFSMTFFSQMKAVLGKRGEPNRAVVKISFNEENSIFCLCSRTSPPGSLLSYLRKWKASADRSGLAPAILRH